MNGGPLGPATVVDSLRETSLMFWATLWPLILGFGLSGVVQAFVPRDQMHRVMGDHRPRTVARASGLGMVSSSCSYAATAMAKSLFVKGADLVTAMVFMFASTNLVLELGIVLVVLMGWEFAAAEFVGGPIMIALLALTGTWVMGRIVDTARQHATGEAGHGGHDHAAMVGVNDDRLDELAAQPWSTKLRSKAAWADAASYTVADLKMLRKELVIGYVIAGALTVAVPVSAWNGLFWTGHGVWTSVENVLVGPLVAIVSFVCSVGNVPLAAALWNGGISFGGVVAFVFADLITLPLVLIYRKYYGTRVALRLLAWFWLVMAAAGLAVEGLFAVVGLIPERTGHAMAMTHAGVTLNYTTVLNLVFLGVFAYLYWLYRHRDRLGGGQGLALDPVCGMQVRTTDAPATSRHDGQVVHFCSDHCRERFDADPARYADPVLASESREAERRTVDPVCGMTVDPAGAAAHRNHRGTDVHFCSTGCAERFDADPDRYPSTDGSHA